MTRARIETILGMILATSGVGARGCYYGNCGGESVQMIPVLPPSADGGPVGDAGDFLERACAQMCANGVSCTPTSITQGSLDHPGDRVRDSGELRRRGEAA